MNARRRIVGRARQADEAGGQRALELRGAGASFDDPDGLAVGAQIDGRRPGRERPQAPAIGSDFGHRLVVGVDDPRAPRPGDDAVRSASQPRHRCDPEGVGVDADQSAPELWRSGRGAVAGAARRGDDRARRQRAQTGDGGDDEPAPAMPGWRWRRARTPRRQRDLGVLAQDLLMEIAERFSGLDAQFLGEQAASGVVDRERFGLPTRSVEREHELSAGTLAQRLLGHQALERRDDVVGEAELQARFDGFLASGEDELLECGQRGSGERRVGEVAERRAAPQAQRVLEQRSCRLRVPGRQRLPAALEQQLEANQVNGLALDVQEVSRRAGRDDGAEGSAQLGHVSVQGGDRSLRRVLAPDALHEPRHGDDPSALERQHRQHGASSGAPERRSLPVEDHLKRPQQAELERGVHRPHRNHRRSLAGR